MECEVCHYTFRSYPEGVRAYSGRSKRLVFLGVILWVKSRNAGRAAKILGTS